jgi:hypothetical protein
MAILLFLGALIILALLDAAAIAVGVDSRDGAYDTHAPRDPLGFQGQ